MLWQWWATLLAFCWQWPCIRSCSGHDSPYSYESTLPLPLSKLHQLLSGVGPRVAKSLYAKKPLHISVCSYILILSIFTQHYCEGVPVYPEDSWLRWKDWLMSHRWQVIDPNLNLDLLFPVFLHYLIPENFLSPGFFYFWSKLLKKTSRITETLKCLWKSLSRVQLFVTPWTIQSMEFSRPGTGVGSLSLLQWIFLTQELIQPLLHCRQILYQLSYQGSPHDVCSLFLDSSAEILFYMHMCRGRKNKCGKILRTGESQWRVYGCSIYIIWLFLWVGNSK